MADVDVSVAICTRNRALSLRETLESLCDLDIPEGVRWELLVIDNGSTDATGDVVLSFRGALPIRLVSEPRAGLAHARNRAVDAAGGALLLWTDDDIVVDSGWLAAYVRAAAERPGAAVFGGPIAVMFEGRPPPWLLRVRPRVGGAYAARDLGPEPVPLDARANRLPFGANYAIRTDVQRKWRYDPALGRQPGRSVRSGEETALLRSVLASGEQGWWVPDARVTHRIGPERQTERWLRAFYTGYGEAAFEPTGETPAPTQLLARALAAEARYRLDRWTRPPERWIESLIGAAVAWGEVRAARARSGEAVGAAGPREPSKPAS